MSHAVSGPHVQSATAWAPGRGRALRWAAPLRGPLQGFPSPRRAHAPRAHLGTPSQRRPPPAAPAAVARPAAAAAPGLTRSRPAGCAVCPRSALHAGGWVGGGEGKAGGSGGRQRQGRVKGSRMGSMRAHADWQGGVRPRCAPAPTASGPAMRAMTGCCRSSRGRACARRRLPPAPRAAHPAPPPSRSDGRPPRRRRRSRGRRRRRTR